MYELMLVANVDRADQLLSRVEKNLKEANAVAISVDRLGKKPLAYSIMKQNDAIFFVVSFEAESGSIKSVWDKLRLEQEDLLRYLLIHKPKVKASKKSRKVAAKEEKDEEKEKPKVTVAVKKASTVKSEEERVSEVRKVSKVSKGKKTANKKSIKSKKGKSKKE
ncbi:30S ribosomal protein S6 [Candidatus Curtissbacteria bacterium RIFCSPLOWO2_01_FULL_38_11b]|uniref:Small ribosomal subunit protein bS6 n=1 Tax=Candidatus Curtissbacteria bacterium RIFCSPLOWO2_01_FULL_38_11b TaxID=1797725 RepID=A0A1F5GZY4_9BACT|nr:MAG: 30S ribosomal protein S6 [Candidatus Curtissbacteria bacterium RIFCSPLOWO2_01_FULL_38_11b]